MSGAGAARGRRSPVVWSGRSAPGDPGATGLLQAVRNSTAGNRGAGYDSYGPYAAPELDGGHGTGSTQLIDLLEETQPNPVVGAPHQPGHYGNGPLLPPMRRGDGAYDPADSGPYPGRSTTRTGSTRRPRTAAARTATPCATRTTPAAG